LTGEDRLFGQPKESNEAVVDGITEPKVLQAARLRGPRIVFLGVKEKEGVQALPTGNFKSAQDLPGSPFFALDVTNVEEGPLSQALKLASEDNSRTAFEFSEPRTASVSFSPFDASLFALARSMIDWNARNKVSTCHGHTPNFIHAKLSSFVLGADLPFTHYGEVGSSHVRPSSRGRIMATRRNVLQRT
jgi:NAD+ diphosphatase